MPARAPADNHGRSARAPRSAAGRLMRAPIARHLRRRGDCTGRRGTSVNDPTAREWIESAVRRHEGPLTLYAVRLLGDVDRARDVVQDTFLRLWQADRAAIEDHLTRWLYTVCRNRALDVRRKERRMSTLGDHQVALPDARTAACETPADGRAKVLAVLDELPERQQEVVRLKFQGGLSYKEIAEVMGTNANNVGVMLHTAIKGVRRRLAEAAASSDPTHGIGATR